MRHSPLPLFLCALALVTAAGTNDVEAASKKDGLYIGLNAGGIQFFEEEISGTDFEYDAGYIIGVSAGVRSQNIRIEGQIDYVSAEVDQASNGVTTINFTDADVEGFLFSANGYYDFVNSSNWTPYLGAGVGLASTEVGSIDKTSLMGQAKAGIAFDLSSKLSLVPGYRYLWINDGVLDRVDGGAHILEIGTVLSF